MFKKLIYIYIFSCHVKGIVYNMCNVINEELTRALYPFLLRSFHIECLEGQTFNEKYYDVYDKFSS